MGLGQGQDLFTWVDPGYTPSLLWVYPGFTLGIPWVYPGYTLGLPWVYPGNVFSSSFDFFKYILTLIEPET